MSNPDPQTLPLPLIEALFGKLILAWGRDFLGQWPGVAIEDVQDDWAARLGWTLRWKNDQPSAPAIDYALSMLPEKPLNAIAFNKLCRGWSPPTQRALALDTKPMPEMFKEAIARLHEPVSDEPPSLRWARRYVAKWGGMEKLIARRAQHLKDARRIIELHEAGVEADAQEGQVPA